jgi:hypothetical protein
MDPVTAVALTAGVMAVNAGLAAKAAADANKVAATNQRNATQAQAANEEGVRIAEAQKITQLARSRSAERKARRAVLSARGMSTAASSAALETAATAAALGDQDVIRHEGDMTVAGLKIDTANRVSSFQSQKQAAFSSTITGALQGLSMGLQLSNSIGINSGADNPGLVLSPETQKMKEAMS